MCGAPGRVGDGGQESPRKLQAKCAVGQEQYFGEGCWGWTYQRVRGIWVRLQWLLLHYSIYIILNKLYKQQIHMEINALF